jgi:hypothetical protein
LEEKCLEDNACDCAKKKFSYEIQSHRIDKHTLISYSLELL